MREPVYLVEFDELLGHATSLDYHRNQTHDISVNDNVPPMHEQNTRVISMSDIDDYGWSTNTKRILRSFTEENGIVELTLI